MKSGPAPLLLCAALLFPLSATSVAEPQRVSAPRDCQAVYGLSCEEVDNWQPRAMQRCLRSGRDDCNDAAALERRYKPRPLAETREIARRAALRNNRDQAKALHELQLLFTDYCAVRVELYCSDKKDSKACEKKFGRNCRDSKDFDAVLAQYSKLSPSEQARIRQVAKEFGTTQESELTRLFKDTLRQLLGFTP